MSSVLERNEWHAVIMAYCSLKASLQFGGISANGKNGSSLGLCVFLLVTLARCLGS